MLWRGVGDDQNQWSKVGGFWQEDLSTIHRQKSGPLQNAAALSCSFLYSMYDVDGIAFYKGCNIFEFDPGPFHHGLTCGERHMRGEYRIRGMYLPG